MDLSHASKLCGLLPIVFIASCASNSTQDGTTKERGGAEQASAGGASAREGSSSDGQGEITQKSIVTTSEGKSITREKLYQLSKNENRKIFGTIVVDEKYLYFSANGLFQVDKNGGGEPERIGGEPTGFSNQNIYLDATHLYWLAGADVVKHDKGTKVQTLLPILKGVQSPSIYDEPDVLIGDADRLYFTKVGCEKILSIAKDGTDYRECSQKREGSGSGAASLTLNETHVYCSGSVGSTTGGKMYRCNKSGTPLEYVTSVTDPHSAFGSQVDPMVVIGDEVYYMNIYTSGSYRVQKPAVAPAAGGDSSVLEEIVQAAGPHRLLYDQARDTFYWHGVGKKCIFKYNRRAKTLQSALSNDGNKLATYPLAQDTEYLYWPTNNALYRMQKF